jgi:acetyl esterase/lipase
MNKRVVALLLPCLAGLCATASGQQATGRLQVAADGKLGIQEAELPLSSLLSPEGRQVLMRTRATEGPGAPVPLPQDVGDMAQLRRAYDANLRPNVDHMRETFPVDIEETSIDGIPVAIITPKGGVAARNRHRLILNGPGGGFRTGVRSNGLLISIPMAATLRIKVVSILYRQGPEFQFPAASEDLLKVWNHYAKSYKARNMGMLGCSAGGALVSQTAAMLIEERRPTPGALGVYCSGLGAQSGGDSAFFGALAITNVANAAAGGATAIGPAPGNVAVGATTERTYYTGVDLQRFIVNPTLDAEKLRKFPPTLFFTATRDFAMSPSLYSYRKLIAAGVDAELLVFDGLYHGFMTNPDFPESREGYRAAATFFDRHLGR